MTPELSVVVSRLTGLPLTDRKRRSRDLGELMVIAHAVVAAEQGNDVTVLIDDREGRWMANQEARRLSKATGERILGWQPGAHKYGGGSEKCRWERRVAGSFVIAEAVLPAAQP